MKIEDLLTRPEGKTLEFKQDLSSPRNILKTLTAEMRRSALNLAYDEEPMPDINPDKLDVRVASGLFAGLREWNESGPKTLCLFTRRQGRLTLNIQKEAEA